MTPMFGRTARAMLTWVLRRRFPKSLEEGVFAMVVHGLSLRHHYVLSFRPEHQWISRSIQSARDERDLLIRNDEAANLALLASATSKVEGDLAEVGCYQGASAKIICEAKGDRSLHLFDTFEGLPEPGPLDDNVFAKGNFKCALEEVRGYLAAYPNVYFHKGVFPSTAGPVKNRKFAFVNLDVDLYESTRSALEFFYPRMTTGGVLISHDYAGVSGVRRAFDEFFEDKPEAVIPLIGSQCMVVRSGAAHDGALATFGDRGAVQAKGARFGQQ